MLDSFAVALPLTMAVVMIASGIAKLRHPDDLGSWEQLGVPATLRKRWLVRLHPWGELTLGVALALSGGVLGLLAALVCLVLMVLYSWIVLRALRQPENTECACFGARKPVTRVTALRNGWLTLLAIATTTVIWTTPLFGGALAAGVEEWSWVLAAVIAAVTAALIVWPTNAPIDAGALPQEAVASVSSPAPLGDDYEMLEYTRSRTPAVPLTLANGTTVNLRDFASRKPVLLLAVSETCGSCEQVIEQMGRYRGLLPEVDIRMLVTNTPEGSTLTDTNEPQTLHDPHGYVRSSIADWQVPTALLLGVDGMLAGGPETGPTAVEVFVGDIYESLHGTRPVPAAPRAK